MGKKHLSIWTMALSLVIICGLACYAAPEATNSLRDIKAEDLAGKIRVTITTTEPADFLLSKIYQPPQLIVDIVDAINELPEKSFAVGKGVLQQIKTSQYERVPTPVVRIIMDCSKWVRHDIARKDNQLFIDFYQPELLMAKEEVVPPLPPVPPEEVKEERLISLDFKDANMGYVLKFLAEMTGFNIVASEEVVKGKVTMYLMDVPFMTALDMILKTQGLWYKVEENIIRVMTVAEFEATLEARAELTKVFYLQYADAETLAEVLNDLLGAVKRKEVTKVRYEYEVKRAEFEFIGVTRVIPDVRSNSLIATTDTSSNFVLLERLIKELDHPIPQVLIEALVMEVTLEDTDKAGFWLKWSDIYSVARWDDVDLAEAGEGIEEGSIEFAMDTSLTYSEAGDLKMGLSREHISALFQAITSRNKTNILSTPSILTLDNQEAVIFVGSEYPFLKEITEEGVAIYEYRDVGIKLTVTPQINIEKSVNMVVEQELMKYGGVEKGSGLPFYYKRNATASLLVDDGQTIIIGGIIKEETTDDVKQVPFLGSIPILGYLFKRTEAIVERTELMIFITPHVILTPEEAKKMTKGQEEKVTLPPPPRGRIEGG